MGYSRPNASEPPRKPRKRPEIRSTRWIDRLDVDDHSIHVRVQGITAEEFLAFLKKIDAQVPADLDCHIVLDTASTHKTAAVKRWLAAHPRFVLHFTPTSASWLNLVERWFAELTTKELRRGTHTSGRQLNQDVRAWIDTWNDNPRPYVWTKSSLSAIAVLLSPSAATSTIRDRIANALALFDRRDHANN